MTSPARTSPSPSGADTEIDIDGHAAGLASVSRIADQVTGRFAVAGSTCLVEASTD